MLGINSRHVGREGGEFDLYHIHSHAFIHFKNLKLWIWPKPNLNKACLVSHTNDQSRVGSDLDKINLRRGGFVFIPTHTKLAPLRSLIVTLKSIFLNSSSPQHESTEQQSKSHSYADKKNCIYTSFKKEVFQDPVEFSAREYGFQVWQLSSNSPRDAGAESDGIINGLACESTGPIIKCIAISPWTSFLEEYWVRRRPTCIWISILPTATILICPKCFTCALTSHHMALTSWSNRSIYNLELFWTA